MVNRCEKYESVRGWGLGLGWWRWPRRGIHRIPSADPRPRGIVRTVPIGTEAHVAKPWLICAGISHRYPQRKAGHNRDRHAGAEEAPKSHSILPSDGADSFRYKANRRDEEEHRQRNGRWHAYFLVAESLGASQGLPSLWTKVSLPSSDMSRKSRPGYSTSSSGRRSPTSR